ncbi:MAG: DUF4118 domain-containing protein [Lachnospiraceae bacterium]|nr:DUF4118 domain-containing protein [Lachnospiraceae bacterium]
MKFRDKTFKNIAITVLVVILFFGVSILVEKYFNTYVPIPAILTLGVFVVSIITKGYVYGIVASMISVLALNYAFTFPYFKFNFTIPENLVSAVVMLIITSISSTLITKVRRAEVLKVESEKEKLRANLLRAVSHDLRTPLTTIYGSSAGIADNFDSLDKDAIIELAQGIKEDSQWLITMVENLLSVTKINGQGVSIKKTPIMLEELIDTTLVKFKSKHSDVEVEIDIPDEFMFIPMDAMLIGQVIMNILENAIRHGGGTTRIVIKVRSIGDRAVFEISNNGNGIPKDIIDKIFTGYYEKKDKPVDSREGMGIGLSVCHSIIKAHGGDISAENLKPKGCCFRFWLSLEANEDEC